MWLPSYFCWTALPLADSQEHRLERSRVKKKRMDSDDSWKSVPLLYLQCLKKLST